MARLLFKLVGASLGFIRFRPFLCDVPQFPTAPILALPMDMKLHPLPADNLVRIASLTEKLHAMHDRVRRCQRHSQAEPQRHRFNKHPRHGTFAIAFWALAD
jgi:hypothetical protein